MRRRFPEVLGVVAALGLAGCGGTAVLIRGTAHGGMIGLDGDREQALADARRLMSEACSGAYTIVGERNAVAGTYHGRALSEHQIRYVCGAHPEQQITPSPPIPDGQ